MFDRKELIREALLARERAYAPYSHFKVGAALLGESGRIWRGCNIENAAFTPTSCAERTALFKAYSEGEDRFTAVAVVGGAEGPVKDVCAPCGVCRQALAEFCDPETFVVILAADEDHYSEHTLSELLPQAFVPARLRGE